MAAMWQDSPGQTLVEAIDFGKLLVTRPHGPRAELRLTNHGFTAHFLPDREVACDRYGNPLLFLNVQEFEQHFSR